MNNILPHIKIYKQYPTVHKHIKQYPTVHKHIKQYPAAKYINNILQHL